MSDRSKLFFVFCFLSVALRDASQPIRWSHGINGGPDAWSLLWRREHGHAAGDGASKHGSLKETFPSSASTATAAGGPWRPKTRVNSLCGTPINRAIPQISDKAFLKTFIKILRFHELGKFKLKDINLLNVLLLPGSFLAC